MRRSFFKAFWNCFAVKPLCALAAVGLISCTSRDRCPLSAGFGHGNRKSNRTRGRTGRILTVRGTHGCIFTGQKSTSRQRLNVRPRNRADFFRAFLLPILSGKRIAVRLYRTPGWHCVCPRAHKIHDEQYNQIQHQKTRIDLKRPFWPRTCNIEPR